MLAALIPIGQGHDVGFLIASHQKADRDIAVPRTSSGKGTHGEEAPQYLFRTEQMRPSLSTAKMRKNDGYTIIIGFVLASHTKDAAFAYESCGGPSSPTGLNGFGAHLCGALRSGSFSDSLRDSV